MKILILANNDVGLYQFRKELVEELLKEHEVAISLPYGEWVEPFKEMGCVFVDTPIDRRGVNPKTDARLLRRYISLIGRMRPDLVITYTVKPNIYGGIACRLRKTPYAVNITGLGTAFQKQGMLKMLVSAMYKAGLKKARSVFFENAENRAFFMKEGIVKEERAFLLHGAGISLSRYPLAEYPKDNGITRFLFMGRIMQEKGVDELFLAMKKLIADGLACSLDVLGGCEEDYEQLLRQYEREGWLHYHGYQKDVRPFIADAHCFVLPSWHEGMANTNLECAASGRPVITSDIAGCREAVIDGASGFLCRSRDDKSLYEAMKRFIGLSVEEREKMGLAGRGHMEEVFDKRKVVARTMELLFG